MKTTLTLTFTLLALIINSCTQSPTTPEQSSSQEFETLAKNSDDRAQIETSPPSGTQYGTGNSTWTASGDEYLQDGYWIKNIYSNEYEIDVFESTLITLDSRATFGVTNPSGVTYKHYLYGWISLTSSGFITTDSLKTNSVGSCSIGTEDELGVGGVGGNGS